MIYTNNENIALHYNLRTKDSTACLNRKKDFNDYIDLYHDEDLLFTEEQYTFYVSSI